MAKLKANDGFEIEFLLHRGIQIYFHTVTIRFWKDGKGWLIPEGNSEHCDPIDYENYRLVSSENHEDDYFLRSVQAFYKKITSGNSKAEAGFEDWPDGKNSIHFSSEGNSDIVNIYITTEENLYEINFKNHEPFPDDTLSFDFQSTKQDFIVFYEELIKEFNFEISPKRIYLSSKDKNDEPWDKEKELIKKQIILDTDKPVIILDDQLLVPSKKGNILYTDFLNKLKKDFKIIVFTKEEPKSRNLNDDPDILVFKHGIYPKNEELIYLRADIDPRVTPSLQVYCCLDRYITSIWFYSWCKKDWNVAYDEIIKCVNNPLPITSLDDDSDWYCPF